MKRFKTSPLQITVHVAAWIPLLWLIFDFWQDNVGPDPIREATLRTGKAALILLVAALACTPINTLFGFKPALKLRRPLGLYSFMYASIHFAIFIGVDYGFNFKLIPDALLEKHADRVCNIPIQLGHVRSLNLSNCAAIVLYESLRQCNESFLNRPEHRGS